MKRKVNVLIIVYQLIIAYPLVLLITLLVALATIVLSPLFPNHTVSYFPARWWGRVICFLFFVKVRFTGLENVDTTQSCIIAANHQSMFDIFIIYGWLPYLFKWVMKAELRRVPFIGKACESAGHIFINRSNPVAARKSIEKAERQLKNGISLVIFPEGTRTSDGSVGKFKKGAFRIAADLQLPILPVSISGAFARMPRSSFVVQPGIINVHFHSPIDVKP
ncbi:MAG: lysophospholipid acyltransferase family protein, partial [Paludibacter sp.]|nr:lysophospholipid acyltransferase family protein [Paludibacter sp.]